MSDKKIELRECSSSWIVLENGSRTGVLYRVGDGFRLLTVDGTFTFDDDTAVSSHFGTDVFASVLSPLLNDQAPQKTEVLLHGYPVKVSNPIEIPIEGSPLIIYTAREGSDVFYAAGYHCLKFSKGWASCYCPKLSTVSLYQHVGPFKTKMEMQVKLRALCNESGQAYDPSVRDDA